MPTRYASRTRFASRDRMASRNRPSTLRGSLTGAAIGSLSLGASFTDATVELPFTESTVGAITEAVLEYRQLGSGSYLPAWPMHVSRPANLMTGLLHGLTAGTTYEARVTVNGVAEVSTQVTTRSDNIPSHAALLALATYYVDSAAAPGGNGSSLTPWQTLDEATASAPSGAVVRIASVGNKYYTANGDPDAGGTGRTAQIQFVTEYPAVNDAGTVVNTGNHAFIDPRMYIAAVGASWVQTDLTGPGENGNAVAVYHNIYKTSGVSPSPISGAGLHTLCYAATRAGAVTRAMHWRNDGANGAQTPARWAEWVNTNRDYRYGFFVDGTDIYVRMPDDADPNTFHWFGEIGIGVKLYGVGSRISGAVVRGAEFGIYVGPGSHNAVIDHCWVQCCRYATYVRGSGTSTYADGVVRQYNRIEDSFYRYDASDTHVPPWDFIKNPLRLATGNASARQGPFMEGTALHGRGQGRWCVVRNNRIIDCFNGISHGLNTGFGSDAGQGLVSYGNTIRGIADDVYEFDFAGRGITVRDEAVSYSYSLLSTAPVAGADLYGPIDVFRVSVWRSGSAGLAPAYDGTLEPGSIGFKWSKQTLDNTTWIRMAHITFWSDDVTAETGGVAGPTFMSSSGGGSGQPDPFYARNIVIRVPQNRVISYPGSHNYLDPTLAWDADYNAYASGYSVTGSLFRTVNQTSGGTDDQDWTEYLLDTGQDTHSLSLSLATIDGYFTDPTNGDLTLSASGLAALVGVVVPGISTGSPKMGYAP